MPKPHVDPVRLEVFYHLVSAWCEEAGVRLQRSAASPNIRERRDFSVALYDGDCRLIAQAAHIPVHLGSAGQAVRAAREAIEFAPGDVAILNDPYAGGTHLPDITMVRPVFGGPERPLWFLVNRAHHADVGGSTPGSMGIVADLHAEGLVLPPVLLRRGGELQGDLLRLFARNVRGAAERVLDLRAQEASLAQLEARLRAHVEVEGLSAVQEATEALFAYTERTGRTVLQDIGRGPFEAEDHLEDDGFGGGPFAIALRLERRRGRLVFDWRGTCDQARGGVNANPGIALAASVYCLRCLCPDRLPTNEGLFRLVEIKTREGSLVDPLDPAPVAGGNVETSQRLVDVAFAALQQALPDRVPAASAGTMSNLAFGGVCADGRHFSSYETLPGGAGASPRQAGRSAVQTHMTNTRNTPIEEFEHRYPLTVRELSVRRGSGGRGQRKGGDGIRKVVEAGAETTVTFLGERHDTGPPGAAGGEAGEPGRLRHRRGRRSETVPSKASLVLEKGESIVVETPGGGGHGPAS